MTDSPDTGSLHNGFNSEYKATQLKDSSWTNFAASSYLRKLVCAFVAAGAISPSEKTYGEDIHTKNAESLNTTSVAETVTTQKKLSLAQKAVKEAIGATEAVRKYRNISKDKNEATVWLGIEESEITSVRGNRFVKESVTATEIAGHITKLILELKSKSNGKNEIAVGTSGSMPALNAYTRLAIKSAGCKDTSILSAASSQWGANSPDYTYPAIEKLLVDNNILPSRSIAASLGGKNDQAEDISKPEILISAIEEAGIELLESDSVADSIKKRMELYYGDNGDNGDINKYLVYINVGGGIASVADTREFQYPTGLIMPGTLNLDLYENCVLKEFLKNGTPVLNFRHVTEDYINSISDDTKTYPYLANYQIKKRQ